jgi:hypothetical protein
MAKKRPAPTREDALKVARYLGCRGAHQDESGTWFPCANAETMNRISGEAEPKSANPKKKRRRRFVKPGYEPLGERGVLGIDTLPGGGLVSGKGEFFELKFHDYEIVELKAENYTKPELRERIKNRIMAGSRGGKPGQWSARKAQLLAIEYRRAGGGYKGPKKKPQRSLDKWTSEEWTTSDGKPAIRKGGTTRYLPKKAWAKLTPAQREATNRKKRQASRSGRQFVANTERAREAGSQVRNSQKSIIIGRAKPRRGDPDVYDDPNAARLRSRALGCIGIARRETPNGEIVWTPCTNVSDFRRRTGQSVLGQRDESRRLQRRLREVGGPAITRRRMRRSKTDETTEKVKALPTLGSLARNGSRRQGRRFANMGGSRIDGDGDGFRTDPRTGKDNIPVSSAIGGIAALMERLKDPDGGFTFSINNMSDVPSGWAIARKGQGIRIPVDKVFDDDGNVTEDGLDHLEAFLEMHKELFQAKPGKNRQISLGAWHDPETKQIYFDVTDVHTKESMTLEQAIAEAKDQNQISIVDLDELRAAQANDDWKDRTVFHSGGGDGTDLVSESRFNKFLETVRSGEIDEQVAQRRNDPRSGDRRVVISDDGVDMMFATPIEELAEKHGVQRDWQEVRALPQPRRQEIADLYDEAEDLPAEEIQEEVRQAYEALVLEVEEQFEMLTKELGVNVEFMDTDPYENFYEMLDDYQKNKRLKIMRTSATGGHPFMTDEQNDMFRAVHDAFGHLATGRGFDRHGEEAAYQAHKSMFGNTAVKAAATELRGQNAFLIERGFFGPQKLVLLPENMRKYLNILLGYKQVKKQDKMTAQDWSDFDNAYTETGSHHVSLGRVVKR